MYIAVAFALLTMFLAFCSEDAKRKLDEHNKIIAFDKENEQIEDLERKGKLLKLDRASTLTGIDANNNGIRDDIEAYIDNNYIPEIRPAVRQFAKSMQKTLLVPPGDREAAREVSDEESRGLICISLMNEKLERLGKTEDDYSYGYKIMDDIESITTNTEKRLRAYLNYAKLLDGTTFGTYERVIDEVCDEETN